MTSEGDIRVLLPLNVGLSFLFSLIVIRAFAFVGVGDFSWTNVLLGTAFLSALTYVVALR